MRGPLTRRPRAGTGRTRRGSRAPCRRGAVDPRGARPRGRPCGPPPSRSRRPSCPRGGCAPRRRPRRRRRSRGPTTRRGRGSSTRISATIRGRARRHHDHAVGEEHRLGDRVGDEHDRRPRALPEPQQLHVEPLAGQRVEGAERLVEKQDPRLQRQGAGDRHALAGAARERGRLGRRELAQADEPEQVLGAALLALLRTSRRAPSGSGRSARPCARRAGAAPGTRARRARPGR